MEIDLNREYRSQSEIAKRVGVGKSKLRVLITQKVKPLHVKKVGREYRMTERMYLQWLEEK